MNMEQFDSSLKRSSSLHSTCTCILIVLANHILSRSDEVYLIQHYVIKFVSDLQQVGGFLWVLRFPPPIKLTATI